MANVLKKIEVGNPLINLGLNGLYEEHELAVGDERLAAFYHKLLDCTDGSETATRISYAMIDHSVGCDTALAVSDIIDNINSQSI